MPGRDLAVLVDRGVCLDALLAGLPGGDRWEQRGARSLSAFANVELSEVTLTADPPSGHHRAMRRASTNHIDLNRAWLETTLSIITAP
jgi:hypothetical protein